VRDECGKRGRRIEEIEITAGSGGRLELDTIRRLRDLGVARLTIAPPGFDPEGVRAGLHDFADRVIAKV
jgi:hypothetical protein